MLNLRKSLTLAALMLGLLACPAASEPVRIHAIMPTVSCNNIETIKEALALDGQHDKQVAFFMVKLLNSECKSIKVGDRVTFIEKRSGLFFCAASPAEPCEYCKKVPPQSCEWMAVVAFDYD
jgi:hypothetical protein